MKERLQQLRVEDPVRAAWQERSAGDDSRNRNDSAIAHTQRPALPHAQSSEAHTFRHKLMKRPRSPHSTATAVQTNVLPPIYALPSTAGRVNIVSPRGDARSDNTSSSSSPTAAAQTLPVQERQERQMRSFLHNFLADETGQFRRVIDLQQHAIDTGITVTDATVQEVVNAVPGLRGLKLTGCRDVTDAGVWTIARQCAQLDTIYLAQCTRVTELGLRLLAHNCQLVLIDLSDCLQITDSVLQTLAAGCWMLQTCILQRCARVTDAGIVKVAQCCKDLRHLDVSECEHVGEYGDKALVAIGKHCHKLTVLDLYGCRHVHDAGVQAIAYGCPLLTTLKLTGCRDVSSVAIQALAQQCHALQTLSLAGCGKTTNSDLAALATHCAQLEWLDISGSATIDAHGVRALAQSCQRLTYLSLADCPRVGDAALDALAKSRTNALATLSLANCRRITERGVDALTTACTNLVTLDVTGCDQIGRRFLQALIYKLAFVEWATTFVGFVPLPNAAELCRQRDQRIRETQSAIKIQAAIRGCRARGGLYEAKLKYVERRVLPKIQARVRGFLVRKRLTSERQRVREDAAVRVIGREYRNLQLRRMLARAKRMRRIRESEEEAALVFQKLFRGYQGRKRVRLMREEIQRQQQLAARIHAMRELAAVKLQRAYRGHRGRSDAALRSAAREAKRRQAALEQRAALYLQRVYRGHQGRQLRAKRLAELLHLQQQHDGAVKMQKVYRGHRGRRNAMLLREDAKALERLNAVLTIQRYWRGIKQKHLAAVLLGLIKLRAREHVAAQTIQAAYRMYTARGFAKTMRLALLAQRTRVAAATTIQRVLRGHRGRAACEVARELRKLEAQARPLFAKHARLQARVVEQREQVEALTMKLDVAERDERTLTLELEKTMQIKTKYHDSSRITGTPQRYLTQYLQVQLADQLRAKRLDIALDHRTLETMTAALSDVEKQLRVVIRALEPLTDGVVAKTRENRTKRLQETVRHQRRAAVTIQRHFRGFRVRCAVREGSNCWLELWTADAPPQVYYYNALTGVTRWHRPLAMDIFVDTFAVPLDDTNASIVDTKDTGINDTPLGINTATSTRSTRTARTTDGAWYEAFDDTIQATYFFHSGTREYQWEKPAMLGNAYFTASESSRRRRVWLDEQRGGTDEDDPAALEALLATTVVRPTRLGAWEMRVEPVSEHFFFYHPQTRELRTSLSPRSVHASIGDTAMHSRRSARSIGGSARRPLHWQYRYGYEYTSRGELVVSPTPRRIWTEYVDEDTGCTYYYNALTSEYRWERPEDVDATYEQVMQQPNSSRAWFDAAMPRTESGRESARIITARSVKTRALGKKWVEYCDPATQHTYYYNEITGETRWSLSPRSARDMSDSNDDISLALFAQVKQLRDAPVAYADRAEHMAWLETAMDERNWKTVDVLVQQILLREQSEVVATRKQQEQSAWMASLIPSSSAAVERSDTTDTEDAIDSVAVALDAKSSRLQRQASSESAFATSDDDALATRDTQVPVSAWTAYVDESGNTFYYNDATGETSWSDPTSLATQVSSSDSAVEDDSSAWQVAYDGDGNAYFYNSATGETSWTDPRTTG